MNMRCRGLKDYVTANDGWCVRAFAATGFAMLLTKRMPVHPSKLYTLIHLLDKYNQVSQHGRELDN